MDHQQSPYQLHYILAALTPTQESNEWSQEIPLTCSHFQLLA